MMSNKKTAIISWVLSALIFLANILMSEGKLTEKGILDYILSIALLLIGFGCWRKRDKKEE